MRSMTIDDVARDVVRWQRQTFPRGRPVGCAEHLVKEANELLQSVKVSKKFDEWMTADPFEAADVFFMLLAVCDECNINLTKAVAMKLEINKERTWKAPNALGIVEHVDDDLDKE